MQNLSMKEIAKNSMKYSISDWKAIIILGVLIYSINIIIDIDFYNNIFLIAIISFILITLSLFEMGYCFKIIEETLEGSKKPPIFENFKEIIHHGIKDAIIYIVYSIIALILFIIFLTIGNAYFEFFDLFILICMVIISFLFLFIDVSIINLAKNKGKIKFAFKIKDILNLLKKIGFKRFIFVNILYLIVEYLLFFSFSLGKGVPYFNLISFPYDLLLTPFLIFYSKRTIGLLAI